MNRITYISLIIWVLSLISCQEQTSEEYQANWESLKNHEAVPEWFADAKLGVYFHWGVYSVPAWSSEWYPRFMYAPNMATDKWGHAVYDYHRETYGEDFHYHDFIPMWKADNFNAKEWVDMFEGLGAKFIGSIAEHHDGFSLWQSEINEWNSFDMGPKVDVVKAIAEETRKRNLKFMATFHHGFHAVFYPKEDAKYIRPVSRHQFVYKNCEVPADEKYKKLYGNISYKEEQDLWLAKLDEVIENYTPDYIWMDFGQRYIEENYRQQFLANYFNKAKELNQEVVVNTKGSFFPEELAVVNVERGTMEDIQEKVWITDFVLGSGWCFNKDNRTAINPANFIRVLAEVVSKNGVVLLSAGPMADGTMPEEQVKAMEEIGAWLKLYGEAIYETRPFDVYGEGPTHFKYDPETKIENRAVRKGLNRLNAEDIRYTTSGKTIYAIQLGWNGDKKQRTLESLSFDKSKVLNVEVLGSSERIAWEQTNKGLSVAQPDSIPEQGEKAIVYKITVKLDK